jgi:hypothetical protein
MTSRARRQQVTANRKLLALQHRSLRGRAPGSVATCRWLQSGVASTLPTAPPADAIRVTFTGPRQATADTCAATYEVRYEGGRWRINWVRGTRLPRGAPECEVVG